LNICRSDDRNLVRRDRKTHQLKSWKFRSWRTGSVQYDGCDSCNREQVLHDHSPLVESDPQQA
jgi:hypothetical protein